jgi:4-amino-4-deoxy-L-arabinose transferase-like glycosyltransferase
MAVASIARAQAEPVSFMRSAVCCSQTHVLVVCIMAVAAVKQVVHALLYPPFQGHDEVAHIGYMRVLVRLRQLPTFSDRLPDSLSEYARYTLDWPALYTANHPPLYYVLAAPAFVLAGESELRQLYFVRLAAIPFFLAVIWLSYRIAATLIPDDAFLALTVPAVIAMQPQLAFEGAIVNNDIASVFFGALILHLCIQAIRVGLTLRRALTLGIACGLGLLTKATLTALLPVVAVVLIWCVWPRPTRRFRDRQWWGEAIVRSTAVGGPAILLPLPWYLFLRHTYGDFTAFEATRELQRDWNRPSGSFGELLTSSAFHAERFKETWGYYGWKLLPLSSGELQAVDLAMGLAVAGLCLGGARFAWRWWCQSSAVDTRQVAGVATLIAACLTMYGAMVYFGTMFQLTQARYVFPVLPAAAVLAMLGLRALVPAWARAPAAALVIAAASVFQVLLLTRLVLPYALS